jgi:hypothetical protein
MMNLRILRGDILNKDLRMSPSLCTHSAVVRGKTFEDICRFVPESCTKTEIDSLVRETRSTRFVLSHSVSISKGKMLLFPKTTSIFH